MRVLGFVLLALVAIVLLFLIAVLIGSVVTGETFVDVLENWLGVAGLPAK